MGKTTKKIVQSVGCPPRHLLNKRTGKCVHKKKIFKPRKFNGKQFKYFGDYATKNGVALAKRLIWVHHKEFGIMYNKYTRVLKTPKGILGEYPDAGNHVLYYRLERKK